MKRIRTKSAILLFIVLLSFTGIVNVFSQPCQNPGIVFNESIGTVTATTAISVHETANGFDNDAFVITGTADIRATNPSSAYGAGNPSASGSANVFFTNTAGRNFIISGINSLGDGNLQLAFGIHKNTSTGVGSNGADMLILVSTDGINYNDTLTFDPLPTGSGTAVWHYRKAKGNIPRAANLRIQFRQKGTVTQYRIDDIKLSYGNTPDILVRGATTFCNGDSVVLSTSESSNYLWSNGATTQSISAKVSGNYSITVNCIPSAATTVTVTSCSKTVNVKLYIEGFYTGSGNMNATIDPNVQPLITDSVILTLHDTISGDSIAGDVSLLKTDGSASFIIPASLNNFYYLSVKHRNTLEVWSKEPVSFSTDSVFYDFTNVDTSIAQNPIPSLLSISPGSILEGSSSFTLTVNGSDFISGSTIQWDGVNLPTTFVSSTILTAVIPAINVAATGSVIITVITNGPGGGVSNLINFIIIPVNPVPSISALTPNSILAGSTSFTLSVTGNNFILGSSIIFNGATYTSVTVSPNLLTCTIPDTAVANAGTKTVTVFTPGPGGGTSSGLPFTITTAPNSVPVLNSISPTTKVAGAAAFSLTATGSNFINGSVIQWNGVSITTNFVSTTQLTATISAALIDTAGTVSVRIFTPSPGGGTSSTQTFTITAAPIIKKFLFDATKAETAGNADWVIDQDGSPQRFPTPAQSNVISTTPETFWNGAISAFGIDIVKSGNLVETLPVGTPITYGNSSNTQDLSNYNVFVIDEPNILFTATEKTAIINFVNNGGGLFFIVDHTGSDRNNDGFDSPDIYNDLIVSNGIVTNPFGITVDFNNFSLLSSNVRTNSSTNPILNGSYGTVTQIEFNAGASLTISPAANSTVTGLVWRSSVTQNNSNLMCASATYGQGRVFVIGDSSPMDDGTGAAGNTLFDGYSVFSHKKLFMNAALWLAKIL